MFQATIIGNLGADAEVKKLNGNEYLSFRVAHSEKRGEREFVQWVSVLAPPSRSKLAEFLKKGTRVCVVGRCSVRAFSSPKTKQWEAGVDVFADVIELVGVRSAVTIDSIHKALGNEEIFINDLESIVNEYKSDKPFD